MNSRKVICFLALIATIFLASNAFSIDGNINSTLLANLRSAALTRINFYRYLHQAPPVQLDDDLNVIAQAHSDYMASTMNWGHSQEATNGLYGENIYMMGAGPAPIQYNLNAVESWYDEVHNYNFTDGTSTNGGMIGHFTAMMWDDVEEIGLGYSAFKIPYNEQIDIVYVYVTLNLSPTPNILGTYPDHVHPQ